MQWGSMNKMTARNMEQEEVIRRVLSSDRKNGFTEPHLAGQGCCGIHK